MEVGATNFTGDHATAGSEPFHGKPRAVTVVAEMQITVELTAGVLAGGGRGMMRRRAERPKEGRHGAEATEPPAAQAQWALGARPWRGCSPAPAAWAHSTSAELAR